MSFYQDGEAIGWETLSRSALAYTSSLAGGPSVSVIEAQGRAANRQWPLCKEEYRVWFFTCSLMTFSGAESSYTSCASNLSCGSSLVTLGNVLRQGGWRFHHKYSFDSRTWVWWWWWSNGRTRASDYQAMDNLVHKTQLILFSLSL